jgi:hypothetical protein
MSANKQTKQPEDDDDDNVRQCLDPFKLPKILQDFPSHRIFRRMHGILNVGKKNN